MLLGGDGTTCPGQLPLCMGTATFIHWWITNDNLSSWIQISNLNLISLNPVESAPDHSSVRSDHSSVRSDQEQYGWEGDTGERGELITMT